MNHLTTIVTRQRGGRVRDLMFAVAVAFAAAVSILTVSNACHAAAAPVHVAQR